MDSIFKLNKQIENRIQQLEELSSNHIVENYVDNQTITGDSSNVERDGNCNCLFELNLNIFVIIMLSAKSSYGKFEVTLSIRHS